MRRSLWRLNQSIDALKEHQGSIYGLEQLTVLENSINVKAVGRYTKGKLDDLIDLNEHPCGQGRQMNKLAQCVLWGGSPLEASLNSSNFLPQS